MLVFASERQRWACRDDNAGAKPEALAAFFPRLLAAPCLYAGLQQLPRVMFQFSSRINARIPALVGVAAAGGAGLAQQPLEAQLPQAAVLDQLDIPSSR